MYTIIKSGNMIKENFHIYYNDLLIGENIDINRVGYIIGGRIKI